MTWNKKNRQFALSCGLRPSSEKLAHWIICRTNNFKPTEKLIDLRDFNREIGKDRLQGEYDRKTIKEAIAQLDELTYGWFTIVKSHTWALHTVLVRPVEMALQNKSQLLGAAPKLKAGNPMFSKEHKKASRELLLQNISKLDSLLQNLGLKYSPDALMRIWRYAGQKMSEVENAVSYMLECHNEKLERQSSINDEPLGITTPKGWLHDCLKHGWHIFKDEPIMLPRFDSVGAITNFIKELSSRSCQT